MLGVTRYNVGSRGRERYWFYSLMNVCLIIIYFSTNNSIKITKREIRNFLSQLSLKKTQQLSLQLFGKAPAKSGILARNYHKKGPRNPGGNA